MIDNIKITKISYTEVWTEIYGLWKDQNKPPIVIYKDIAYEAMNIGGEIVFIQKQRNLHG